MIRAVALARVEQRRLEGEERIYAELDRRAKR
jgi:hypothetical protein